MKGSRLYLRIEDEVKEKWMESAKKKGVTLSDYVRTLVEPEAEPEVEPSVPTVEPVVRVKVKKARGLQELPSQDMGGFVTRFK